MKQPNETTAEWFARELQELKENDVKMTLAEKVSECIDGFEVTVKDDEVDIGMLREVSAEHIRDVRELIACYSQPGNLLDEVKALYQSVQNFDDIDSGEACESSQDMQEKLYSLRDQIKAMIVRHSQPLTPEAVVEWMKSKGEVEQERDMVSIEHHLKLGNAKITTSSVGFIWIYQPGRPVLCVPFSRFHSLAELKSFVRVLGVEA